MMKELQQISIRGIIGDAQSVLTGNWGTILGVYALYIVIAMLTNFIPFSAFIIEGPLHLGITIFTLNLVRRKTINVNMMFEGFNNFLPALGVFLLTTFIVILGLIFFIIPGIILGLGLSQSFFILADNPNMPIMDVLKKSFEMMKGYKTKYFMMSLVFGLMMMASILTLGLALFWIIPVAGVSLTKFYTLINDSEGEELSIEDNLIL